MANNGNLRKLTTEQAKNIGKMGGINSGKVRAERKRLRECFEILLTEATEDEDGKLTGIERIALATYRKALSGDIKAIELIRANVGEEPPKREISDNTQAEIEDPFNFKF